MHVREYARGAHLGPLALCALASSELALYGERGAPLDLTRLTLEGRRVLLLSSEPTLPALSAILETDDPRPVTLIVPDGSPRQKTRGARRVSGLESVQRVRLDAPGAEPPSPSEESSYLQTARALGHLESEEAEAHLRAMLTTVLSRGLARTPRQMTESALRQPEPLPVLFEDEHLVVINKPSGLSVHRGWSRDRHTALSVLRDQLGQFLFPVHRLDRATSGALTFAKNPAAADRLQTAQTEGQLKKQYLAVCRGNTLLSQRFSHPLTTKMGQAPKPAVTEFEPLGTFERYSLIKAVPLTGRTHQIRRHLKHLSHPLLGDVRYGKGEHNRLFRERFGFHRLALHCVQVSLPHPVSGALVSVTAPLHDDLRTLLEAMNLLDRVTA